MSTVLIIGGTGFIGKEMVKQLAGGQETLLLLVRSPEKARSALHELLPAEEADRVRLLKGDLTEPALGMEASDYEQALASDVIVHAGGTMSVTMDRETAKRMFVDGARHVGELAERIHREKGLRHLIHLVGYMSPFHDNNVDMEADVYRMDEFMKGEPEYERMKFLADLYVRQQAALCGYPLTVVNPSTVIGAKPAGVTEQTGGLGILVDAVRRGWMPVVPGGVDHWIPFVANDDMARAIVYLIRQANPDSRTVNMLEDKSAGPDMKELLTVIAQALKVKPPAVPMPVSWLRALMKAGGGKLTGIPPESLSFITDRTFRTDETKRLLKEMEAPSLGIRDVLPMVIADLDHRLTHSGCPEPAGFRRERKGDLAALVLEGSGAPWILVHGLLASADDFAPLAGLLHERSGRPVWLLDLPGFGRSPALPRHGTLDGYAAAVGAALAAAPPGATLVGHSLGANVAAVAALAMPQHGLERLILLQPVLHPPRRRRLLRLLSASPLAAKRLLRGLTAGALERAQLQDGAFADAGELPSGYAERIVRSLKSPRIAAANAELLHLLHHRLPEWTQQVPQPGDAPACIIWGGKDQAYSIPQRIAETHNVRVVPYGHQFPVSHPAATAELLSGLSQRDSHLEAAGS
ncbi:alpha/beta fold hydrolase [Paenibacillus sp. H1-7]|uniref:alpha/beta fold hydrolase n=1 Tax=Paenibacillus sp. H1-7 TaxID=2282849 RepID=UPI001EF83979|nr:alpha/beta fold hydrolase [Paenibacillus sp. H1-7]ULL14024.1 alpha/beta fold hydrolase [Paenibacillus sp. H1-7]